MMRVATAQAVAVGLVLAVSGVAAALSGGGYTPRAMDCSNGAEAYDRTDAERGCHAVKVNVESGGVRYAEAGIDQTPNGQNATPGLFGTGTPGSDNFPHAYCAAAGTGGTGGGYGNNCGTDSTPKKGVGVQLVGDTNKKQYRQQLFDSGQHTTGIIPNMTANGVDVAFGADDNLDGGEHDGADGRKDTGTDQVQNGPSDGGAVQVHVRPAGAAETPSQTNLIPILMVQFGSCADGICEDITTYKDTMYQGGGQGERDAADYEGKKWDPFECNGASRKGEAACDGGKNQPHNLNDWRNTEGTVSAQPGVQIYEDPDAQASPIDPLAEILAALGMDDGTTPLYPLPGTYVGSCGLILDGQRRAPGPAGDC
jgi:hypothetical protein